MPIPSARVSCSTGFSITRWNALEMGVCANRAYCELGGPIASCASAAEIFEVGFNHVFRGKTDDFAADLVYFQPHSAPASMPAPFSKAD
ncbi:hypothetical protein [Pararhodobacter marinus]|uniref:hypothetical protein n=1 Tax=Pararhodobacter marinus TaxID=2184063 RepID=UPI001AEF3842|nr:hypothetical protein [Pararhodobacter marinus]